MVTLTVREQVRMAPTVAMALCGLEAPRHACVGTHTRVTAGQVGLG